MNINRPAVICAAAVLLGACGRQSRQCEGQVFITLENRQTIKLSLVELWLVESNSAMARLNSRGEQISAEKAAINDSFREAQLQLAEIDTELAAQDKLQSELDQSSEQLKERVERLRQDSSKFTPAQLTVARSTMNSLLASVASNAQAIKEIADKRARVRGSRASVAERSFQIDSQLHSYDEAGKMFDAGFTPIAKTVTDADGKFVFELPADGNYLIVGAAERRIADQNERLRWMAPAERGKPTLLHSMNMFAAPAGRE